MCIVHSVCHQTDIMVHAGIVIIENRCNRSRQRTICRPSNKQSTKHNNYMNDESRSSHVAEAFWMASSLDKFVGLLNYVTGSSSGTCTLFLSCSSHLAESPTFRFSALQASGWALRQQVDVRSALPIAAKKWYILQRQCEVLPCY